MLVSDDLKLWNRAETARGGLALHKDDSFGDKWFWAPEVYRERVVLHVLLGRRAYVRGDLRFPIGPFTQREKPMLEGEKLSTTRYSSTMMVRLYSLIVSMMG